MRPFAMPPIDMNGNFPAHVSLESPYEEKINYQKVAPLVAHTSLRPRGTI
jgi:hypothetical protein